MKAAGKFYEPVTYDGAGHGFMRAGEDPGNTVPGNKTAREQGFARLVKLLGEMKQVSAVENGGRTTVAGKAEEKQVQCHATAIAGTM
jgi:carboxymethylenebutenolidase